MKADEFFMSLAVEEARKALVYGDVPVGCVMVSGGEVISCAHNERERLKDPTAHAEVLAMRRASEKLGRWRLDGTVLYVTLEPCIMCAGTMVQARIDRLVYGAVDFRYGAAGSIYDLVRDSRLNHWIDVTYGVMEEECGKLLSKFFSSLRKDD